jgi:butyrate kinase
MMTEIVPVINPGSTSTKIAVWTRDKSLFEESVKHPSDQLAKFDKVTEQYELRLAAIRRSFDSFGIQAHKLVAVAGRGAPLKPLEGGTYSINQAMLDDLHACKYANHASNLGAIIATKLAEEYRVEAYVVDPITIDNFIPEARISGVPEIPRKCRSHALNIKANAREVAASIGRTIETANFIVAHLGGGVSVCALRCGAIIDVNDALLGMGPFSPDRAGALPIGALVKLCYSGKFTEKQMTDRLSKESGLLAYLGTSDLIEVEKMIGTGDSKAREIFNAMTYQIAKEIGAMSATLRGDIDGIILTGGMAHSRMLLDEIEQYVSHIGKVFERPGELEMRALAEGVFRVVDGKETPKEYI